jgi:hypothetical protein
MMPENVPAMMPMQLINTRRQFDEIDSWEVTPKIAVPQPRCITRFESYWKQTCPGLSSAKKHMYGEASAGSLWKIWAVIFQIVGITADDVVGDWGSGAGKMVFSKQFMCSCPDIPAIGMEIDASLFQRCQENAEILGTMLTNTRTFLGDSASVQNWAPITIMLQYDGPTNCHLQEYHLTIMRAVFSTVTVRCVFSTKLDKNLFRDYFSRTKKDRAILTAWKVVKINGLVFGKSQYKGYLWIRKPTGSGTRTRSYPAEGPRDTRFCLCESNIKSCCC